jgi:hypothetical protein
LELCSLLRRQPLPDLICIIKINTFKTFGKVVVIIIRVETLFLFLKNKN